MKIIYEKGDWVKLVSTRPTRWASDGQMDKFFGIICKLLTIKGLGTQTSFHIIEISAPGSNNWTFTIGDIERPATPEEIEKAREVTHPYFSFDNFKVGEWVSLEKDGIAIISRIKKWESHAYCELENGMSPFKYLIIRAAMRDIEAHLIKEAEARGFIKGNYFKSTINDKGALRVIEPFDPPDQITWYYSSEDDTLRSKSGLTMGETEASFNWCTSNPAIYRRGVWCEIVEKPIKIGTNKVNFSKDASGKIAFIHVECKTYSAVHILQLFEMLTKLAIDSISTEGEVVAISKIEEIVEVINKHENYRLGLRW